MKKQTIADAATYCDHLDGLRGIAILMVIVVHAAIPFSSEPGAHYLIPYTEELIAAGSRGVQLFFILSAFTLFHSSKRRFDIDRHPKTSFYIRRAFRILPFWWLACAYFAWETSVSFRGALPSVLFYFGFIRFDPANELVSGGWSLFVEETFYLFLPFILSFVTGLRRAVVFLGLTGALAVAWVFGAPRLGVPTGNSFVWLAPPAQWFCFGLGIIAFQLFKHPPAFEAAWHRSQRATYLIDACLAVMLIACVTNRYLASFVLFALVYVSNGNRSVFGRLTRQPWLMSFGRYCYSLYLIHTALIHYLEPARAWFFRMAVPEWLPIEVKFAIYFPFVMAAALGVGFLSFNLIEKPCVNLGKQAIQRLNASRVGPDRLTGMSRTG